MAAAHIVRASFNDEMCDCLAGFTQDAEHSLAAVYHCFQEIYGDRAAWCAAEAWLRMLEERVEEPGELPELTAITAAAIAFSVSNLIRPYAKTAFRRVALAPTEGLCTEPIGNPGPTSQYRFAVDEFNGDSPLARV